MNGLPILIVSRTPLRSTVSGRYRSLHPEIPTGTSGTFVRWAMRLNPGLS